MGLVKLGGSMHYLDLGPGSPKAIGGYTVGGRSVHSSDASSGLSKGTVRDMRPHTKKSNTSGKAQPFVIKRQRSVAASPVEEP